jgi:hypothetical protein
VAGLARDVAAGQKEIGNAVDFRMGDEVATGGFDRFDVGLRGLHRKDLERRQDSALVWPIRVNVDDQRRTTGAVARRRDGLDDGREASG